MASFIFDEYSPVPMDEWERVEEIDEGERAAEELQEEQEWLENGDA